MTASGHLHLAWDEAAASGTEARHEPAPDSTGPDWTGPDWTGPDWSGTRAATVLATGQGRVTLDLDGRPGDASVALSCLVRPEPGDRVLAGSADRRVWVLAVLTRGAPGPLQLSSDRDIAIVSTRGGVSLAAAGDIAVDAGQRARLSAGVLELHAATARLVLDEVLHVGRIVTAHVSRLRSIGDLVETFAEHVLTRARRSSRFVEEADQLRGGEIDHRAEGTLQLQGKTAFITGETLVRVDADQIHMG